MGEFGRMENLIKEVRKSSLFRSLIPMECETGWPLPSVREGILYITIPFFNVTKEGTGRFNLFPFSHAVTIRWDDGKIVQYINYRYENPFSIKNFNEAVGIFPHDEIKSLKTKEYEEKKMELMNLYDEMFGKIAKGENVDKSVKESFARVFSLLTNPGHGQLYSTLAPNFCKRFLK